MMRKRFVWLRVFAAPLVVSAVAATALADEGKDEARGKEKRRPEARDLGQRGYDCSFHEYVYATLGIAEGHLPPPGECRRWFPGKPPRHQPPPGECGRLSYQVPAGSAR